MQEPVYKVGDRVRISFPLMYADVVEHPGTVESVSPERGIVVLLDRIHRNGKRLACKAVLEEDGYEHFPSGAVRKPIPDSPRYDLLPAELLRELAVEAGKGNSGYPEGNWDKMFPYENLYNHLMDHLTLWRQGDRSQKHILHAILNLFKWAQQERSEEQQR